MSLPRLGELLLAIADEEDLGPTAERFGLSRAVVQQLLRNGARALSSGTSAAASPAAAPRKAAAPVAESATDELPWNRRLDRPAAPAAAASAARSAVPKTSQTTSPTASPELPPASAGTVPTKVLVYSDGAARGNPGPAGAGAVVMAPDGRVLARRGKYLGRQTNNVAEYEGVLLGLRTALELGAKEVEIRADSMLLVKQLQGEWKVKHEGLKPLVNAARGLLVRFDDYSLRHVRRELNTEADEMSNRAIDERM